MRGDAMTDAREVTNKLIEMVDEGLIKAKTIMMACLNYMSEADVADMAHTNELIDEPLECPDCQADWLNDEYSADCDSCQEAMA